jgi:hypothetical protein
MERAVALVAVDLDKLLENGRVAADALDSKAGGIVPVTKYCAIVLIVRVLWTKESGTDGAGEMLDVILFVCTRRSVDVGQSMKSTNRKR